MKTPRRNILTMLGLASVGSAAVAADDVTNQGDGGLFELNHGNKVQLAGKYDPERMATAFERLAVEVRSNKCQITRFHIGAEPVGADDWLRQTLTIDLELYH